MSGFSQRLVRLWLVALVLGAFLPGCSSDSNGTTDPIVELITVTALADQLSVIAGGDVTTDESQKSIKDLSDDIAKVMASKGEVGGGDRPGLLAPSAEAVGAGAPLPIMSLLWAGQRDRPSGFELPADLFASLPPGPPLGITCVWNVGAAGWAGSENIFGPVPDDGIRFELYETEGSKPVEPLDPLITYVDVRPRQQSSVTGNSVNVTIDAALKSSNSDVMSYLLAGQSDPDAGLLDLLMAGSYTSAGGNVLDFVLAIDGQRASTTMRVQDLLINTSLDGAGNGLLSVRKQNNPRQLVEFNFQLSGATSIASGSVIVNNDQVASMTGARLLPSWNITSERFEEADNLNVLYDALIFLDSVINIQFFFSHCIGADHPAPCQAMVQALGQ